MLLKPTFLSDIFWRVKINRCKLVLSPFLSVKFLSKRAFLFITKLWFLRADNAFSLFITSKVTETFLWFLPEDSRLALDKIITIFIKFRLKHMLKFLWTSFTFSNFQIIFDSLRPSLIQNLVLLHVLYKLISYFFDIAYRRKSYFHIES